MGAEIRGAGGAAPYTEMATQNLGSAATAISVTDGVPVTPITTSGVYTLSASPLITPGRNGQLVILKNVGSNAFTITDMTQPGFGSALIRLNSSVTTRTLNPLRGILALVYNSTMGAWVEHYFNDLRTFTPSVSGFTIDGSSGPTREVAAATTLDSAPDFDFTYVGTPTAASVAIITGSAPSGYPATVSTPFLTLNPAPQFYRATTVSGTVLLRVTATVSGTAGLTRDLTVTYINRRYAGPNSQSTLLSSAQVLALDGAGGTSDLSLSQYGTFSVSTTTGEYIWFAHRSALTAIVVASGGTAGISVAGEIAGFSDMGTITHVNDFGFSETFRLYRSTNTNFGASQSLVTSSTAQTNRIYMGPSTDADPISTANIRALDDTANGTSDLSGTTAGSYVVTITGSNYLWFCHPDRYADLLTIKDSVTGFAVAGSYRTNVSHTNDKGYVETYRCWRSDNVGIYPSAGTVVVT